MSEDVDIREAVDLAEVMDPMERRSSYVDVELGHWIGTKYIKRAAAIENISGRGKAIAGSLVMSDLSNVLWAMSSNYDGTAEQQRLLGAWDESLQEKFMLENLTSRKGANLTNEEASSVLSITYGSVTTNTFTHLLNGVTGQEYSPRLVSTGSVKDMYAVDLEIKNDERKIISLVQLKTTKNSDRSNVNVWRVSDNDNYNASYWRYLNNEEDVENMDRVARRVGELNPGYTVEKYVTTVPPFTHSDINNIFGVPTDPEIYDEFAVAALREGLVARRGVVESGK